MSTVVQRELRQKTPLASPEQEAYLALQIAAHRVSDPWIRFLKAQGLTPGQYNVLRILRGAQPDGLTCGEIAERMITRDPDITRLLDRLEGRDWACRSRSGSDRRVIRTAITAKGLAYLKQLDAAIADIGADRIFTKLGKRRLKQLNELLADVIDLATGQSRTDTNPSGDTP
jgi:DNA-binding MarR family transcriptional regulator